VQYKKLLGHEVNCIGTLFQFRYNIAVLNRAKQIISFILLFRGFMIMLEIFKQPVCVIKLITRVLADMNKEAAKVLGVF